MVKLSILYCRSILEQSSVVWSTSLNNENIEDLERLQKSFCKMVLGKKYTNYETALLKLNLISLEKRRTAINLKFAKDALESNTMNDIFIKNKNEQYSTRNHEQCKVFHANTERKRKFSVIQMQHQLNKDRNKS